MRDGRRVETRRDRKALARDAGMGPVSAVSVLAGALCALAAWEILIVLAGAIGIGIHGSTNFASVGTGQFKTVTGIIVVATLFISFMFGGYVSGRTSRRRGATHGLLAGVVGAALATVAVAAVTQTGADNGVARVARHIQVADTWHQWRYFGLIGIVVAATAMVLGGLAGGVEGERWHGKLLDRAVDPSFGPEAEERAAARKRVTEAEVARLAAAEHVGRLTGAAKSTRSTPAATEPVAPVTRGSAVRNRTTVTPGADMAAPASTVTDTADAQPRRDRRSRHLLGRR